MTSINSMNFVFLISKCKKSAGVKNTNKHLFLTGYMGSGKSVVGIELAKMLSMPFYDLDKEVEKEDMMLIPEIFKTKGEKYFRILETDLLKRIVNSPTAAVIALGGGTLVDPVNRNTILSKGVLIFLDAPIDVIIERVKDNLESRPLVSNFTDINALKTFVQTHYNSRKRDYVRAQLTVQTSERSPEEVASDIIEALKKEELYFFD